jgi:hypothetical protein
MTKTHGMSHKPIYKIWQQMKERCHSPNAHNYKYYGARGIKVCEKWHSFENFYDDMGDRPQGMSIERVDNDKGYSPENCIWADKMTQSLNKRTCKFSWEQVSQMRRLYKTKSVLEIADIMDSNFSTVHGVVTNRTYRDKRYIPPLKVTSQYKGVCKWANSDKWRATYKRDYLGTFDTEEDAFCQYLKARNGELTCQEK